MSQLRKYSRGEEEDVDTDEGDLGLGDHVVVGAGGTDDGGDELADQHAESTPDEEGTTTELLDGVEGDGGGADVDKGGDEGDQEGVRDRSEVLEEGGTLDVSGGSISQKLDLRSRR